MGCRLCRYIVGGLMGCRLCKYMWEINEVYVED